MYQARLRQQEVLNQKAKEALEQQRELKKKPINDDLSSETKPATDRMNQASSTSKLKTTKKSHSSTKTIRATEYNPMQPWSAGATGGTYR
jgi:hypothetical protein